MQRSALTRCVEMGDACSSDKPRRRPRPRPEIDDEIEDGEIVPGCESGSETEEEDGGRYVFKPREDEGRRPEIKRRRMEDIVAGDHQAALPSPTPSCGSDETISDDNAGAAAAQIAEPLFPCPVCRTEFSSMKAVHGHMRVHAVPDPRGREGQEKKKKKERPVPAISGGWAMTGKRGFVGGRDVNHVIVKVEEVNNAIAIVVPEPGITVFDAMPMVIARAVHESSSAEQNPNEPIMAAVHNPSNQAVLQDPPTVPQFVDHFPGAPLPLVIGDQPPAPQPAAAAQGQPAPPEREEGWFCKEEGCNKWYATHQGLGGHMAGHKNKQNQAAAGGCRASVKPEKTHMCKVCGNAQPSGVALGGHMRKHYNGVVRPKKRDASAAPLVPKVEAPELGLALLSVQASQNPEVPELTLTLSLPTVPAMEQEEQQPAIAPACEVPDLALTLSLPTAAAMEQVEQQPAIAPACEAVEIEAEPAPVSVTEAAEPATAPAVAGTVRIFGVNIVQAPAVEEVSCAVTDPESSASTDIPRS